MPVNTKRNIWVWSVCLVALLASCLPKEQVVFKSIKNLKFESGLQDSILLKGDVVFYNPNKTKTKLKEIKVDIIVNGKKMARVDQKMKLPIPPKSTFEVPIIAQISIEKLGLLDAVLSFLSSKSYQVELIGHLKIQIHGITVKAPIKYHEELKLSM